MKRKALCFLVAFGPEVRAFLYSGLLTALQEYYDISIVTVCPESAAFAGFDDIPRAKMPEARLPFILAHLHGLANQKHRLKLTKQGKQVWQHYLPAPNVKNSVNWRQKLRKFMFNNRFLLSIPFEYAIGPAIRACGTNPSWQRLFAQLQPSCLILSPYSHPRVLPAIHTAHNMGIKRIHINNSWKDVYTNPYIPVIPSTLVVWNSQAAKDIGEANPELSNSVEVSTSLHLQSLLSAGTSYLPRNKFCEEMGLAPSRPYINYTASAPTATVNEVAVVEFILEAIRGGRFTSRPQLLLRLNPMEDGNRFIPIAQKYAGDLIIQKPLWEWFPELDWCCALPPDVQLWQNTIYHSALNVSIPSTVTMEYLALQKSVINIVFDMEPVPASISNKRFWTADFYAHLRKNKRVTPAFSPDELLMHIGQQLTDGPPPEGIPDPDLFPNRNPVRFVVGLITELVEAT